MAEVHGNRTNAGNVGKTVLTAESGAKSSALVTDCDEFDADLRAIFEAWPGLSCDARASLVAIVKATTAEYVAPGADELDSLAKRKA
jgi:hypothetical protein